MFLSMEYSPLHQQIQRQFIPCYATPRKCVKCVIWHFLISEIQFDKWFEKFTHKARCALTKKKHL